MSQYQHSYSNYVNHILNRSPSKTAYSFSKTERFPRDKPQDPPLYPDTPTQAIHTMRHNGKSPNKSHSPFHPKSAHQSNPNETVKLPNQSVQNQIDYLLRKIERKQELAKSPNRSTQQSPLRKTHGNLRESPNKWQGQNSNRSGVSPNNKNASSPRRRIFTEMDSHPSKNISVTGYYPVGVQINASGRYPTSKIKNVIGPKFGPAKSKTRINRDISEDNLGPGSYKIFSEFGGG